MRIVAKSTLTNYYAQNPQAKTALEDWYEKTKKAEWTCFADIKKTFNSVDSVGNKRYVFNIKGNDYRLIVIILFTPQRVYIRFVGTHAEYDKITNIQNI
ncbi:MAG: type II toxin-antitoxin system HigB family toxin [Prevotella sp.]|nr:type II toxin-antitoxin system HigB family toxin [Prevotella sp.]